MYIFSKSWLKGLLYIFTERGERPLVDMTGTASSLLMNGSPCKREWVALATADSSKEETEKINLLSVTLFKLLNCVNPALVLPREKRGKKAQTETTYMNY